MVAYQNDVTWEVGVADATGTPTTIVPAMTTDGGLPPNAFVAGKFVFISTDYTVYQSGSSYMIGSGTLSVWSKTLGSLKQLGTSAFGPFNVAPDSSFIVYADHCNADATTGNLAVVAANGTGSVDILTNIVTDESSTSCAPLALFSGKYLVVSYCEGSDAGVAGAPQIASFDSTTSWTKKVLVTNAGPSSPYAAPTRSTRQVDTAGDNVLTIGGGAGTAARAGSTRRGRRAPPPGRRSAPSAFPRTGTAAATSSST